MFKAIKYELNPTGSQIKRLNQIFGNCRFAYNWALDRKIKAYVEDKKTLTCFDLMSDFTALKNSGEFPWLKLAGAQQMQASISNIDKAFTNFFKHKKGFPKFKSKSAKQSFKITQDVKVDYDRFKFFVPKIGWVKFFIDKKIGGSLKSATVSKSSTGRFFVSITYEYEKMILINQNSVGVDLGLKNFAITSDGEIFESQKYLKKRMSKLRVEKRKLNRMFVVGAHSQSKNYHKQKVVVAKVYEKISNQRKDFIHKITTKLAKSYKTICIEDLNVAGMGKNRSLSASIYDSGWGMFRRFLEYKASDLRIIGAFEPSSKICNICGFKNSGLRLSDRTWKCENGHVLDRDLNAAINIKNFGLRSPAFGVKTANGSESCQEVLSNR